VINHCGTPTLKDLKSEEYLKGIRLLAECPNVYFKIGSFGYMNPKWDEKEFVLAQVSQAIDIFTPHRCMFESNFPVDNLPDYGSWTGKKLVEVFQKLA
jgi:predicted TIM-barrel fold metal-dependent hydrolase